MATHERTTLPASSAVTMAAQRTLALQMLDCLRRSDAAADKELSDAEIDLGDTATRASTLLPPDKAAYAVQLGFCLAQHFPSIEAFMASSAFMVIQARSTDDPLVIAEVLCDIAARQEIRAALNPSHALTGSACLVVFAGMPAPFPRGSDRAVSAAAQGGWPVICVSSPGSTLPDALKGPDLGLELLPFNTEMLQLVFAACHGEVGLDDLGALSAVDNLSVGDLVGHIRPARPITACIAGLQCAVNSRGDGSSLSKIGKVRLKDLAGYGEARTWGLELAQDFALWRQGQLSWDEVDHRAIILAGAPGTGKTSFASVLAATLQVPMIASSVAEWSGYDNLSGTLRRMQSVFDEAITKAPCVLLIDEIDGISSREEIAGRHAEYWTQIVNRMLELVTRAMATAGVVIVGATNHVGRIDPALTRAGRLDQIIRIQPPDAEAIAAILARYAGPTIPFQELKAIARRLEGRTGADIEKLVRTAKAAARRAGRSFSASDLQALVSDPLDKLPAQTRRRIAIYRAGQFVVGQILDLIEVTSNDAQGLERTLVNALTRERFPTEQGCNDMLAMIMAGRAAEEIVLGDASVFGTGSVDSDLALATGLARDLEMSSGFGESGLVYLDDPGLASIVPATAIGSIRRRIEGAMMRASALLLENRAELEATASRMVHGISFNKERQHLRLLH